jgi:prevent-host-death family protein
MPPKKINVAQDIIPIGEFKTHAAQMLRQMHKTQRPLIITQNGRAAAVVLTPDEFEALGYREFVKAKIQAGIDSVQAGPSMTSDELARHMKNRRRKADAA